MLGLMQQQPLLISSLLTFAARHHGDAGIVSRSGDGGLHRYTWKAMAGRAMQVAGALDAVRLAAGERVGTIAWNGHRHLELYYGVSGAGRVVHTINPRLHPEQVAWIINHAGDRVLCFDVAFLPLVQAIQARCPAVQHWVALCDRESLPAGSGAEGLIAYEDWIAPHPASYEWPALDEHTASSICYTSGTTGNPKGAVYSHRSTVLHAYAVCLPDVMGLSARDVVLPVVPMFHVNAWGLPFAAALVGCKLVFPGSRLDGQSLHDLMEAEAVTFAAGVPTIWQMLLAHVQAQGLRFSTLRRTVIGGAACPPAMMETFREHHGVEVLHAWGMTETSPLGTLGSLKRHHLSLPAGEQTRLRLKQGRAIFGVDLKVAGDDGRELPWDDRSCGDLYVRGPWVVREYYNDDGKSPLVDGWFPTGDVATIDADGFMRITDRSKDVIKSGGEWISSIDIENVAMAHPAVAMAACIGVPHPKWDERPVVAVVTRPGMTVSREDLLAFYRDKRVAKWQIPDDVVFVDSIPLGATGKMLKTRLREQLEGYRLPALDA